MATQPYLTVAEYQVQTHIARPVITKFVTDEPDFVLGWLVRNSALIESQLRKRYKTPFVEPYPDILGSWLVWLTDINVWLKRGVSATDETFQEFSSNRNTALLQIEKAANAVEGLYDLPLLATGDESAIKKSSVRSYSETSPYVHRDIQREIGRMEDRMHTGTRR